MKSEIEIHRELKKVRNAMERTENGEEFLYGALQTLHWVLEHGESSPTEANDTITEVLKRKDMV